MLINLLLLFFLFVTPCFSDCTVVVGQPTAAAATCTTQTTPNDMGANSGYYGYAASLYTKSASSEFVAGETTTICKVKLYIRSHTSTVPDWTLTAYIFNDSGGKPGSSIGTIGSVSTSTTVTTSYQWIEFTGTGTANVTASSTYHIVVLSSGYNETNYLDLSKDSACATEDVYRGDVAPPNTSWESGVACITAELYK